MKRTLLLLWLTMATLCASAQFETTVSVGVKEGAYGTYHVSYNFEDVCQSLGVEPEEFGHILEVWLDPYPTVNWPDEYSKYESQKYMYLMTGDGRQVMGRQHRSFYLSDNGGLATPDEEYWTCVISIDRRRNRLDFGFDVAYDVSDWAFSHEPKPKGKIGDTFRYTFGIENEGKQATFDITLNMVPEFGGNTLPIDSFEKVGEQEVKLKYQSGKTTHTTRLNLEEIAKAFGGNVRGGNLGLYLMKKLVPGAMTDRFIYCRQPSMLLSDWMAENYYYGDPRALYMVYVPETGELILYPGDESNFEKGEHLTGSAYLVAEGKCYELKLDLQIGDSKQETRNMAVVEKAKPCGTFSRTLTVAPESGAGGERFESRASFSLPVLAKALGADCTELTEAIKYWMKGNNQKDGTEIIYNLTDHASSEYSPWGPGSFMMTKGGKTVKKDGDYTWIMEVDGAMNELQFNLWQEFGKLTDGDVCHTRLGLYYKGRMVTLDLTLNMKKGARGAHVDLAGMKKVGEQAVTGKLTSMQRRLDVSLALDSIAALFSSGVSGKGLKLYAMANVEKGLLTDRFTYEKSPCACLNVEGRLLASIRSYDYFSVTYRPYQQLICIDSNSDDLQGGQKTSASLFLSDGEEYYELMLDLQFGEETDMRESFDIVATEHLSTQLMPTNSYYTYYDRVNKSYALVSTPIDEAKLTEQLGTETPMLFTERVDENGTMTMTSRYNCAPGQGFWFGLQDGQAQWNLYSHTGYIGVYYTEGTFKWYEEPYPILPVGKTFRVNLYMANLMQGTAVKYEIDVEIVREIETPSIAYVHRLPQGLSATGGTNSIHSAEYRMQNESDAVYDLQGRRLNAKPQRGLYIQGGKMRMTW